MSEKPTSARPITVNGVTFQCYRCGVLRYIWRSNDGRFTAQRYGNSETYTGSVDGKTILRSKGALSKRFRSLENAMKATIGAV